MRRCSAGRMSSENKNKALFRENGTERESKMNAQSLVMLLNAFYLVMMGLVAVVGTAALVELIVVLLREKPGPKPWAVFESEDA